MAPTDFFNGTDKMPCTVRFGKQFYVESSLARLGSRAQAAGLPIIILLSFVNQWNSLKIVYKITARFCHLVKNVYSIQDGRTICSHSPLDEGCLMNIIRDHHASQSDISHIGGRKEGKEAGGERAMSP